MGHIVAQVKKVQIAIIIARIRIANNYSTRTYGKLGGAQALGESEACPQAAI